MSHSLVPHMVMELQCITLLWNSSVSYGCDISVSHTVANSNVSHCCGIPVSRIAVEFQCLMGLCNSSVSRGCEIPVSHMAVKFQCLK